MFRVCYILTPWDSVSSEMPCSFPELDLDFSLLIPSFTYTPTYSMERIADVTGSQSAKKGLIDVYDVFGLASQTLQGADMLATALSAVVIVPDFFKGQPAKHEWVPPDTEEKKDLFTKFMTERAAFPGNVDTLLQTVKEAKEKYPSVTAWGSFGLCWGGKVRRYLTSQTGIMFIQMRWGQDTADHFSVYTDRCSRFRSQ